MKYVYHHQRLNIIINVYKGVDLDTFRTSWPQFSRGPNYVKITVFLQNFQLKPITSLYLEEVALTIGFYKGDIFSPKGP